MYADMGSVGGWALLSKISKIKKVQISKSFIAQEEEKHHQLECGYLKELGKFKLIKGSKVLTLQIQLLLFFTL